ncbi:hypothetical protein GEV893_16630 [Xanthomonas perforans]|nr:hypothetical protein GEV872_04265 [Xanthomonas perforans]KLC65971.1 hypothetical protein GEV893_16630 [Xanthomonas perforans]KLC72456.1 hypothetical protein GEV904_18410 [Xanthomonas perforans]KLC72510.1 hypothetical protein GEV909_17870 [Xanthomonas perforans]KLC80184.1 hypothetical protein GEV915_11955 [Xanthomonas perforans]
MGVLDRATGQARTVAGLAGDPHARKLLHDLASTRDAVADLFEKGRQLSADLEHSIAIANVSSPDAVHVRHPIRVALDQFDAALRAAGGAA